MKRASRAAPWVLPSALFLSFYWLGLWIWFYQDDFAWLNLSLSLQAGDSLWNLLFAPAAQGTIRPWSERGFFLLFHHLFGLDAVPYRVCIYVTQIANLLLLTSIMRRLTGSRLAAGLAPVLWIACPGFAATLTWASTYNQILCAFFLLLAFYFFLRHIESGRWRYYAAQGAVFLIGFGALELNVVYPALAAAYALCCSRRHLVRTLPLFAVSAAYAWVHHSLAPGVSEGPYAMHFDAALPATLWRYWLWTFGAGQWWETASGAVRWQGLVFGLASSLGLLVFLAGRLARRQWLAAFFLLWYLILFAPVLPLRDHFTAYYITLPAIGLAMAGAWAVSQAYSQRPIRAVASLLGLLFFLKVSLPLDRQLLAWSLDRGARARNLVLSVGRAQELHPGQTILLDSVGTDLFWSVIMHRPFRLVSAPRVYLTPDSENRIDAHPELADVGEYVLPAAAVLRGISERKLVVYQAAAGPLRNITSSYSRLAAERWTPEPARHVDVGQPFLADQLGEGWYPIEQGYRWMAGSAILRLGGPRAAGEQLHIVGYCSRAQLEPGPVHLSVSVDGATLAIVELTEPDAQFEATVSLPASLVGRPAIDILLEVDRTFAPPGDGRALGAAFGVFSIR